MNRSDADLKKSIADNETYAEYGAFAVVIGLVLEVGFAAFFHEPPETVLSHWGPVFSDVVVTLGVAAEVLFGRKSRTGSEELSRRSEEKVSSAYERAAEADLKAAEARERAAALEQLTAGRTISNEVCRTLTQIVRDAAIPVRVCIEYQTGDGEAFSFSYFFLSAFNDAGSGGIRHLSNHFLLTTVFGVVISSASKAAAAVFAAELNKAGILASTMDRELTSKAPPGSEPPTWYVFIGPKPPPAIIFGTSQNGTATINI